MMRGQRGLALVLVLIFLGVGAIGLTPTLRYVDAALNFVKVSRASAFVQYALGAVTQQALYMLQYVEQFDCDGDQVSDGSFADCVASEGEWILTTLPLPTGTPHTVVDRVNNQDVSVTVSVPGELTALTEPTPVLVPGVCFFPSVSRDTDLSTPGDQNWARVGEPIEYTINILNCSSSPAQKDMRQVAVRMDPSYSYVPGQVGGDLFPVQPFDPEQGLCTGLAQPHFGCLANDNSPLLVWPEFALSFGQAPYASVKMRGGEVRVITFQAIPNDWGIFYIDVTLCYFNVGDPCKEGSNRSSGKVAPVVVGMFNVQGEGKGYAFGASSKLDNDGSNLISQQPQ